MAKNQFIGEYGELSNEILLNIAEILTIRLPEGKERIIASKWVKKFNLCDPKSYQQYLSLFVSCLTKQLLVDPFDQPPKDLTSTWQNFDREYSQRNINDAVIHRLYMDSFTPPYHLDLSSDMKEYVAFQEIPFLGAHFYYAFSPRDKIDKWTKFNKLNVPKSLVEILRKDEQIESPIKGRSHPRPAFRLSEPEKVAAKQQTTKVRKSSKPEWEDLIHQESPAPEPEKKSMIVVPTDVPVKNIPAALQRRMAKAEKDKQERLLKKAQEAKDLQSKLAGPKKTGTSSRPSTSKAALKKQAPKKIKKVPVDDIDANLLRPKSPVSRAEPKSPEFHGPHADLQRRLFYLRQSNALPSDLIKTTHDISRASADINKEAERLQRDGTANIENVERLHEAGLSVGNRILNMLKECQADEIQKVAENAVYALENVYLTMEQLDEMLEQGAQTHDETMKRLNEIKMRMQKSAIEAQNVSIRMNSMKMGHDLIDVMSSMVNVSADSAQRLQNIEIQTDQEGILIDGLENSVKQLSDSIQYQRDRLSRALENNEPNLLFALEQAVKTVDEMLSNSFSENVQLTENAGVSENAIKAIEIDAQKNEQLNDMNSRTLKILHDVELAVSKIMNTNLSNDIIDLDNEDLGFSDIVDDNEMERQRQLRMMQRKEQFENMREKMQLIQIDESENLADVSDELIKEIEKSLTEIDQVLIPGLQQLEINAASQNDCEIIRNALETIEIQTEVLNDSLIEMMNLKETVSTESQAPIDYDLITFDDDEDLINFD